MFRLNIDTLGYVLVFYFETYPRQLNLLFGPSQLVDFVHWFWDGVPNVSLRAIGCSILLVEGPWVVLQKYHSIAIL